jgi:integrase
MYRVGGRGSYPKYGGTFDLKTHANARKNWIVGELAARRIPDLRSLEQAPTAPTVAEAAERWRASRIDASEGTRTVHRVAMNRVLPILGSRRIDDLTAADVADLVTKLAADGKKRGTIKKSVNALAMTLDHAGVTPNPARDKVQVRLPREEREELDPPTAEHVEAVAWLLTPGHRTALLWLDWAGARVGSVDHTLVGDYDESRRRVRIRSSVSKTRKPLWIDLPDELAAAIQRAIGPREDRDPAARLFAEVDSSDALRTAIGRACVAAGVPAFSPHDLRHRRISLLHRQGRSWAEIGRFVGQRSLKVTADTYTHVLLDDREIDLERLLAEAA